MKSILEANASDVMDFIKGFISVKRADKDLNRNRSKEEQERKNYINGSISNYTKNLILSFPMLCDNSLPPSTASMISRANERNIVTMLQLLFSSMQFNAKSGTEVLAAIHKNINVNMSLDDAIDAIDDYIEKKGLGESTLSQSELNSCLRIMMEQLKIPQKSFPVESLSERSLNDYTVYNVHGRTVVREADFTDDDYYDANWNDPNDMNSWPQYNNDEARKRNKEMRDQNEETRRKEQERRAQQKEIQDNEMNPIKMAGARKQNTDYATNALQRQLVDSDVKKANELQPTLMIVKFNEIGPEGNIYDQKPFVAGVKSRLIPVDSSDIVDRVIVKNKTKVNFLNFIRATTGEIKFFRDFIFCIDQAKIDAKNSVKKGEAAQMWKVLETRSSKNYVNKNKKRGNDASAITTLVLNQETVNILKKEYDFDIEKIKNARMILDAYNLLGLFIADESIEVVKFLYAGNDRFEQQAYNYLEKESNDNSYRKVINLIGKMNGR